MLDGLQRQGPLRTVRRSLPRVQITLEKRLAVIVDAEHDPVTVRLLCQHRWSLAFAVQPPEPGVFVDFSKQCRTAAAARAAAWLHHSCAPFQIDTVFEIQRNGTVSTTSSSCSSTILFTDNRLR
uniref:(northern house mosquito) hypothetical protein n=1 Tax=Culex pipiens TaxID=7175 RepID=A0A8D8J746_CULPI